MAEKLVWGIHGGRNGIADGYFLQKNRLALGWAEMGDLSAIPAERAAFRSAVEKFFPAKTSAQVSASFGQIFRFTHEMKVGDIIVYPSKVDRQIHIGEVVGNYKFLPKDEPIHPQTRAVKWLKHLPRTAFSQGALYESGSALTFFQIKTYSDEFFSALKDKSVKVVDVAGDISVATVTQNVEEATRDFVMKTLSQKLKGHPFTDFVAHVIQKMGYKTRISPEGSDGGVDIVAHKDELGFEPPIIRVQVKSIDGSTGDPAVSALYGKVAPGEFGLFVTLGTYTTQAKHFARGKSNLRLIDGNDFVELVFAHYDQFDSKYKVILPLKRVHVPAQQVDEDE